MVRHHVAHPPRPDPVAEGTLEHQVRQLLRVMGEATVYELAAALQVPARAVRNAIERLKGKDLAEAERTEVIWNVTHPSLKTWWRLKRR